MRWVLGYGANLIRVGVLFGAEAQQGGYVSDFVEFGIVLDVEKFDVVANHPGQNRFAYIHDLAGLAAANWTEAHEVGVEVAAGGALDGLRMVVLAYEQSLYFAQFQGVEHAAQSGDSASVVAGLVQGFGQHFLTAALLRSGKNLFGLRANFFEAHMSNLGGKPAKQLLRNVGMELRLELRPVRILATENPHIKHLLVFFLTEGVFEELGDELVMVKRIVGNAALGVASVVASEAVAAAAAG
jgi:hypothetical protein